MNTIIILIGTNRSQIAAFQKKDHPGIVLFSHITSIDLATHQIVLAWFGTKASPSPAQWLSITKTDYPNSLGIFINVSFSDIIVYARAIVAIS